RFNVLDKPGVLAKIASYLGEGDISIASVYQRERDIGSKVPIVIMTHEAKEKNVQEAIQKIDKLDVVLEKTMLIRVLKV
ncbi:MAG: ACT domain-containing protein, partial [Deltaproteobacteria bacterium]|nr:ACT domain-containing protein [Deltaproteobacteria bacterium]